MPTRKLGLLPRDESRPVLKMGRHLKTEAIQIPDSVDYASKVSHWLLGSNDRFGTCGPTSVANLALLVSAVLGGSPVEFTDEEIFDLYRRSGNPDFDPATGRGDNGVEMTVMLSELVKGGIGLGDRNVKALAFGTIDSHDETETWKAAALFGGVLWGATLYEAQDTQLNQGKPWDYVRRSALWGGHAVVASLRYSDKTGTAADRTALVTWAELIDATDAFIERQVDETYVVIFPWHLTDAGFLQGVDLAGVAQEFEALTGRPFPAEIPPAPAPEPTPAPAPAPDPAPVPAPDPDPFPIAALELIAGTLSIVIEWFKRHSQT